jgi:steroid delta-isomerase-like uncharacterized protein
VSRSHTTGMEEAVRRFYDDLWNQFDLSVADELLAPSVVFTGTLQDKPHDLDGFKAYVLEIQKGFSDFNHRVVDTWVDGDTCIARMFWSGTHDGEFRGTPPTGRSFSYPGVAIFRFDGGQIIEVWAVGDTHSMRAAISSAPSIHLEQSREDS